MASSKTNFEKRVADASARLDTIKVPFALGATATMAGIIFSISKSVEYTVIGVVLVFFLFCVLEWARTIFIRKQLDEGLDWLLNASKRRPFPDINEVEQRASTEATVYIITPNLLIDTENTAMIDTVSYNLNKNIEYVFFVPQIAGEPESGKRPVDNVDVILRRIIMFRKIHSDPNRKQPVPVERIEALVTFYRLAPNWMRLAAYDNLMVISDRSHETGFMQIPNGSEDWWARMSREATDKCFQNIKYLQDRYERDRNEFDAMAPVVKVKWSGIDRGAQ